MNIPLKNNLIFCLAVSIFSVCIHGIICLCAGLIGIFSSKEELQDENDYIRKYLDSYLQRNKPGFSVFINGAWGSGKTFFINHYKPKKAHKYKCYVSLFGVVNKQEFEHRLWKGILFDSPYIIAKHLCILILISIIGICLFSMYYEGTLHFLMNNYPIQYEYFIEFFYTLISSPVITSTIGALSVLTAIIIFVWKFVRFKAMGILLRNRFLILDDFERTNASCNLVLSWINEFVEHIGCPTIIIGNEETILEKISHSTHFSKEDYQKVKEKIIGKEFHFSQTDEKVCRSLITQLKENSALKNTLDENLTWFITNTLDPLKKAYNHQTNYRVLALCFGEFDYYFNEKCINDNDLWKELITNEIWKELIIRFMTFMYLKKIHKIVRKAKDTSSPSERTASIEEIVYTEEFGKNITHCEILTGSDSVSRFREIFPCWNDFSTLLPSHFWTRINQSKIIPQSELTEFFINKLQPELSIANRWQQMYYLDDIDFVKLQEDTQRELEHPSLRSLEDLISFIQCICIAFEKKTFKIDSDELKGKLETYVSSVIGQEIIANTLLDDSQYHEQRILIKDKETNDKSPSSIFSCIKEKILKLMEEKHKDGVKKSFSDLLQQLKVPSISFAEWYYKDYRIYKDVFSFQQPQELWEALCPLSTHDFRECLEALRGHIVNIPNGIMKDSEINFWREFLGLMVNDQNQWKTNSVNIWKCDYIGIFHEIVEQSLNVYKQTNDAQ